ASRCWQRAAQGEQLAVAKKDCDAAIAMDVRDKYLQSYRCMVNLKLGDYKGAIGDCDAGIAEYPKSSGRLYMRGIAKLKLSDAAGGSADIAAAREIDPRVADIYVGFGVTP